MKPLRNITNPSSVQDRIEFIRVTLKFPVNDFASKLGVGSPAVYNVVGERGTSPNYKFLQSIVKNLPVNEKWLFMGDEDPWTVKDITKHMYNPDNPNKSSARRRVADSDINSRIKMIRSNLGMSQSDLANTLDVSRDIISGAENNRQGLPAYVLKALTEKLQINANWMLMGMGNMYLRAKTDKDKEIEELKEKFKSLNLDD